MRMRMHILPLQGAGEATMNGRTLVFVRSGAVKSAIAVSGRRPIFHGAHGDSAQGRRRDSFCQSLLREAGDTPCTECRMAWY